MMMIIIIIYKGFFLKILKIKWLVKSTWNHIILYKLFVLDETTWNQIIVCILLILYRNA